MYQFHYGTMRSSFDCRLLYSDTDSLLYRINCEDLYRELKERNVLDQFDFSIYPEDHELYSEENAREEKNATEREGTSTLPLWWVIIYKIMIFITFV